MSNWTYVSGSLGLELSPYKVKTDKDGSILYHKNGYYEGYAKRYLPYGEEQFKILETYPCIIKKNKKGNSIPGFRHKIEVSSFPIIKRDIEELMKNLPSGEHDEITYLLQEDDFHRSSTSDFDSPQTEKIFREAVMKKFPLWRDCTWNEYIKYRPTELDFERHKEDAVLCIHDSLRWCEATEFYESLIELLRALVEKGYIFDHGSFSFTDVYPIKYYVEIESGLVTVTIKNTETNVIQYEYYQLFQFRDLSDLEGDGKRYPLKNILKKVLEPIDDFWPIYEDHFPESEAKTKKD